MAAIAREIHSASCGVTQFCFPTSQHLCMHISMFWDVRPGIFQAHTHPLHIFANDSLQSLNKHLPSKTGIGDLELNSFSVFTGVL